MCRHIYKAPEKVQTFIPLRNLEVEPPACGQGDNRTGTLTPSFRRCSQIVQPLSGRMVQKVQYQGSGNLKIVQDAALLRVGTKLRRYIDAHNGL